MFFQFSGGMWVTVPQGLPLRVISYEYFFHSDSPKSEIYTISQPFITPKGSIYN